MGIVGNWLLRPGISTGIDGIDGVVPPGIEGIPGKLGIVVPPDGMRLPNESSPSRPGRFPPDDPDGIKGINELSSSRLGKLVPDGRDGRFNPFPKLGRPVPDGRDGRLNPLPRPGRLPPVEPDGRDGRLKPLPRPGRLPPVDPEGRDGRLNPLPRLGWLPPVDPEGNENPLPRLNARAGQAKVKQNTMASSNAISFLFISNLPKYILLCTEHALFVTIVIQIGRAHV